MIGKGGRHPARRRGMTHGTIGGKPQSRMAGIVGLIVLIGMATRTIRGCAFIAGGMALETVNAGMCTG